MDILVKHQIDTPPDAETKAIFSLKDLFTNAINLPKMGSRTRQDPSKHQASKPSYEHKAKTKPSRGTIGLSNHARVVFLRAKREDKPVPEWVKEEMKALK